MLAPVTAGWATYLLVHRVTWRWLPSVVSGLLFALSPLETDQIAVGHLNLGLTALVPIAAYLVVRRLEGSIPAVAFVAALGVTLAAELGISTEILATGTLFGALALALLYLWDRVRRPALHRCAGLIALAYAVTGAIGSPLLYAAFALPHPSGVVGTSSSAAPFSGVETHLHADAGAIAVAIGIGLPVFGALVGLLWTARRRPVARALAATAILALVCSVGILVIGSTTVPTPWTIARHVPILHLVRPQRLSMFAWLIAAVGAGAWIAGRVRSPWRWGVAIVAVGALLPAVFVGRWTSRIPPAPARLASAPHAATLAVVAASPERSDQYTDLAVPLVWQVQSSFAFRLANAYVGSFPPELPYAVRRFEFHRALDGAQRATVHRWMGGIGVDAALVVRRSAAALRQDVP